MGSHTLNDSYSLRLLFVLATEHTLLHVFKYLAPNFVSKRPV